MQMDVPVLIIVFLAALALLWTAWKLVFAAGQQEAEKRDFANNVGADGRQKTPLERFVSPGRLFNLQLLSALLPGVCVPMGFLVGGFGNPVFLLAFGGAFAFAGWHLPRLYYLRQVRLRQERFEAKLIDLTMGVTNALKAGMALPQALERITDQMTGPMNEELQIVLREYRLGIDLGDALERLLERMPCEDLRLLMSAIRLTTKTGGSLSEVLAEMTEMIRGRKDFYEKLKTLTSQGRFEGLVLGLAPVAVFIMFWFIQPEFMAPLFHSMAGWIALGVSAAFEVAGFLWVKKIVSIEV